MANIITAPESGIYFDGNTAGVADIPTLTGNASGVAIQYDGYAGIQINSSATGVNYQDRFSVEGANGRLFGVSDAVTGTVFSVNDAAGLPIIEVESTSGYDKITIGEYGTDALVVSGSSVEIGGETAATRDWVTGQGYLTSETDDQTLDEVLTQGNTSSQNISVGAITGSALTIDTNTLYVDATNNRVGIKTTTPAKELDVVGTVRAVDSSSQQYQLRPTQLITYNVDAILNAQSAGDDVILKTQGNSRLIATAEGNVGIGTTAPSELMHIYGAGSTCLVESTDTNGVFKVSTSVGDLRLGKAGGYSFLAADQDGDDIRFFLNPSGGGGLDTKVIFKHSGDVGIGTTSPDKKVDITVDTSDDGLVLQTTSGRKALELLVDDGTNGQGYINFYTGTNLLYGKAYANSEGLNFDTVADRHIRFFKQGVETMRINTSGNVGIGTTSPARRLEVYNSSSSMISQFRSGSGTSSFICFANTGSTADQVRIGSISTSLVLSTNYTERMRIDSSGNVCIGTTTPTTVGGTAKLTIDVGTGSSTPVTIANGTTDGLYFRRYSTGGSYQLQTTVGSGNAGNLSLQSYGGKVGIGTTSPEVKLHVGASTLGTSPDTNADIISSGGITIDDNRRLSFDTNYYVHGNIRYATSGTSEAKLEYQGYYGHHFTRRSGTSAMVIKGDTGNVGIGTTSPTAKLHVEGVAVAGTTSRIALGSDLDTFSGFYPVISTNGHADHSFGLNLRVDSDRKFTTVNSHGQITGGAVVIAGNGHPFGANSIYFMSQASGSATSGTEVNYTQARMIVKNDGNVGIGTTSPSAKLHVDHGSDTGTYARFSRGTTNIDFDLGVSYAEITSTVKQFRVGTSDAQSFHLVSNDSNRLTINSSGNVGIGTTGPAYKLDVNGEVRSDAYRIDLSATTQRALSSTGTDSLQVGDAGVNDIKFKNAAGNSVIIASSGSVGIGTTSPSTKLDVSGSVTATSLIKSGGTSSQFLKADGSVDSNTYLTAHPTISAASSSDNSGRTYIQDITLDGNGHVTGITTATETVTDTNTTYSAGNGISLSGTTFSVAAGGGLTQDASGLSHSDTSSQSSVNNSNGTVIQDITLDTYGHITAIGSANLDSRYYTESESDTRFLRSNADDSLTSVLTVDDASGGNIVYDLASNGVYIPKPQGADFMSTSGTHTGAIAIKLPTTAWGQADMISFHVDIYDYSGDTAGESVTLHIFGYQYQSDNPWLHVGASIQSDRTDRDYTVRFGNDGTRSIVWIGETNSGWSYHQVVVRDFLAGFTATHTNWDTGWDIVANVTSFDTVNKTSTANYPVAKQLKTARNISLTGAVTGSTSFDGSGNVSIATTATADPTLTLSGDASGSATFTNLGNATLTVTVADDSHNHVISNVDGLQSALDLKAPLASPTLTGTPTAPTAATSTNTTQIATTAYVKAQGYVTTDTNTTYSAGNGLSLSGTTFKIDDPVNLSQLTESTDATSDKILLWDESASLWKYMTMDDLQDSIDTNTNTFRTVTAGGNTLGASETLAFTAGTNVSISESAGAVTINASANPTLTLAGDASGSATFTGLGNATLTVTVADDSHNHVISNVDGLQTALDAKAPLASPTFTGTATSPNLTLTSLSTYSGSDITALMINGSNVVGKRTLGTNAFNSTAFITASSTDTLTNKTWNGNVIASAYLDADTAHLSGTQTFSGLKTFTSSTVFSDGIEVYGSPSFEVDTNFAENITVEGGATVDGTVTAGGLVVDTNTLYVDATNNRVGIGTTSPFSGYSLDVNGAIRATGLAVDTNTLIVDATNNRVGIGVSSPDEALHVVGNLELGSGFTIGSNSGSYWQRIRTVDASPSTTNAFNFETRNGSGDFINHMTIRNDGNVGIGTASPSVELDVAGNVNVDSDISGGGDISATGNISADGVITTGGTAVAEVGSWLHVGRSWAFSGLPKFSKSSGSTALRYDGEFMANIQTSSAASHYANAIIGECFNDISGYSGSGTDYSRAIGVSIKTGFYIQGENSAKVILAVGFPSTGGVYADDDPISNYGFGVEIRRAAGSVYEWRVFGHNGTSLTASSWSSTGVTYSTDPRTLAIYSDGSGNITAYMAMYGNTNYTTITTTGGPTATSGTSTTTNHVGLRVNTNASGYVSGAHAKARMVAANFYAE